MSARKSRSASIAAATAAMAQREPFIPGSPTSNDASTDVGVRRPSRRGFLHLAVVLLVVVLLYLFFTMSTPKRARKAPQSTPVKGQYIRRMVAVGDLHGDYDNALKVLHMADVVDANGSWTGNVDYFVQTGDIVDRGVDTIKLYAWMDKLRAQARQAGGELFSHLGNHEFMNALGDWRYVLQSDIDTFGSVEQRQAALATGTIGSSWARNYSVASRIPLHPSAGALFADYDPAASSSTSALSHAALSFMHGGLSPTFSHATPYPSTINRLGAMLLRRCQTRKPQPAPHPPAAYGGLPPGSTAAEHELYGANGPLWYRGWAMEDDNFVCSHVDAVTRKIGVRRLIMGHTPDFEKIVSRCGGKIIIIDTGISKAYSGALSALSITYTLTPIASVADVASEHGEPDVATAHPHLTIASPSAGIVPTAPEDTQHTFGVPDVGSNSGEVDTQVRDTRRWIEREEIVALYPGRRVTLVTEEREVTGDFS